jgi:Tol biopolymer transport system component
MAKTKHFGALAAAAGALVAVALLVLMLVVVNPQPAKAAFPGQNGKIAFASNRNATTNNPDNYEIYTVNSTGMEMGLSKRTDNPAFDTEPAYSPDGSKIAFQSFRNGNWDIWTVNATGTPNPPKRITNDQEDDEDPNWSPDGRKIVFSSTRSGGNEQIWTVSSTGTEVNPVQITASPNRHLEPAYAPNGDRIVFQMFSNGNWNIWTINSAGNPFSTERITDNMAIDEEPAYSPDGSRIAFTSWRIGNGNGDIFSATPFGVEDELVDIMGTRAFSPAADEKPAFSPDGSKIVFDSKRNATPNNPNNWDIFIVNCSFQTPTVTQITNNSEIDYAADWQSLP